MYIYKIENKLNGKVYIGQSTKSVDDSDDYYGSGKLIQMAIKKYGLENFDKTILCECVSRAELDENEIYYIQKYNSIECGYNISAGGNGGNLGEYVNKQISETVKLLWESGRYSNVDFSTCKLGRCVSESTKQKISEAQLGENGYWYGKTFTDETKRKISDAVVRRFQIPNERSKFIEIMKRDDVRKKLSEANIGKTPWNAGKTDVYSDETIAKMRQSAINKNISEETEMERRRKISEYQRESNPIRKGVLDIETGVEYKSIAEYCEKTNTSWYKTKRYRKDGKITIYENKNN